MGDIFLPASELLHLKERDTGKDKVEELEKNSGILQQALF